MTPPREMLPYADPRVAGRTHGALEMRFEVARDGRNILSHLCRRAPTIVQQALYFDPLWPELPCVYVLSAGGPNLGGDRYRQQIELRAGACAHISTGAATKIAEMPADYSLLTTHLRLADNAYAEWLPEPTILCRHARLCSTTHIDISPTATLFLSEIYMAGRKHRGELWEFDILSARTTASRPDGQPLMADHLLVEPANDDVRRVGVMHRYDVWACVMILTPPSAANRIYECVESRFEPDGVAVGLSHLPCEAGLVARIAGRESAEVKRVVRQLCGVVRREVRGCDMPDEFPWR